MQDLFAPINLQSVRSNWLRAMVQYACSIFALEQHVSDVILDDFRRTTTAHTIGQTLLSP